MVVLPRVDRDRTVQEDPGCGLGSQMVSGLFASGIFVISLGRVHANSWVTLRKQMEIW